MLKQLRKKFDRFCFRNREKGIPNLMLYIVLGCVVVRVLTMSDPSYMLYSALIFDRAAVLRGQVWRLVTFVFTTGIGSNLLIAALIYLCYYSLGRGVENSWGTLRFNLFYLCGVLLTDIYGMCVGGRMDAEYLNLSLFLAYAALYPNAEFLILFFIPVKAWILAVVDLAFFALDMLTAPFPYNLLPLVALGNFLLFVGWEDALNLFPASWTVNLRRLLRKKQGGPKVVPFNSAGSYEATSAKVRAPYQHCCRVCGRTEVSNPQLEFRYCSRCKGFVCYCSEHISSHTHITE